MVTDSVGRTIPVSTLLTKEFGACAAMLIQQTQFWCAMKLHQKHGHAWVYKTMEEWSDELGYSASTIKRAVGVLRREGILVTRSDLNYHQYDKTLWYRVDPLQLNARVKQVQTLRSKWPNGEGQIDPMEKVKMTLPIPEKTVIDDSQKNAMNANEILAAKKQGKTGEGTGLPAKKVGKVNPSALALLWKKRMSLEGGFVKNLTSQELGQLGHVVKALGDDSLPTLDWCLQHWSKFVVAVKHATGYSTVPETPQVGFFAKHYAVAVQSIAKEGQKVAQLKPATPVPINLPTPIAGPKKYVEDDFEPVDAEQLQADLAMFEAMSKKP